MTGLRELERQCLIVDCRRLAVDRDLCGPHAHYYRVVLADPYFRNHPCPEPDDAPQLALRMDVQA